MRVKLLHLYTSVDQPRRRPQAGRWHCSAGYPRSSLLATAVVVDLNRKDVEWAKYTSNNACVGVLEGVAVPCHQLAVYLRLSNDRP